LNDLNFVTYFIIIVYQSTNQTKQTKPYIKHVKYEYEFDSLIIISFTLIIYFPTIPLLYFVYFLYFLTILTNLLQILVMILNDNI
jgi:hypothetical protein